jgi:hypothetical protein
MFTVFDLLLINLQDLNSSIQRFNFCKKNFHDLKNCCIIIGQLEEVKGLKKPCKVPSLTPLTQERKIFPACGKVSQNRVGWLRILKLGVPGTGIWD